jgi:hypothetical protein
LSELMDKLKKEYINTALELLRRAGVALDICGSTGKITIVVDNYEMAASGSLTKLPNQQLTGKGNVFELLTEGVDITEHFSSITVVAERGQPPRIHGRLAPIMWNVNVED